MTNIPFPTAEFPVVPTISSLELVDFINTNRSSYQPPLKHDHFLAKVLQVLSDDARNFQGYHVTSNGKAIPCYRLPKREANLMAMSYSHEMQAQIYDRMAYIETLRIAPTETGIAAPRNLREGLLVAIAKEEHVEAMMNAPQYAQLPLRR